MDGRVLYYLCTIIPLVTPLNKRNHSFKYFTSLILNELFHVHVTSTITVVTSMYVSNNELYPIFLNHSSRVHPYKSTCSMFFCINNLHKATLKTVKSSGIVNGIGTFIMSLTTSCKTVFILAFL